MSRYWVRSLTPTWWALVLLAGFGLPGVGAYSRSADWSASFTVITVAGQIVVIGYLIAGSVVEDRAARRAERDRGDRS